MMRLTMAVWWSLALVWLITSQAGAGSAPDAPPRRVEVTGYGISLPAAKKDAMREAIAKLQLELRQQQLVHWQPSETEVQALLDDDGRAGAGRAVDQLPSSTSWIMQLRIPSEEMLRQLDRSAGRRLVAEARMSLALRVLAVLALALAVVVGGIRVDEWTQSRYTNWLRIAGAGTIVAIVGAGWWSMR